MSGQAGILRPHQWTLRPLHQKLFLMQQSIVEKAVVYNSDGHLYVNGHDIEIVYIFHIIFSFYCAFGFWVT